MLCNKQNIGIPRFCGGAAVVGSVLGGCRCGLVPMSWCDSRFGPWIRAVAWPVCRLLVLRCWCVPWHSAGSWWCRDWRACCGRACCGLDWVSSIVFRFGPWSGRLVHMVWRHPPVHGTGKSLEFRGSVVLPWQIPDARPYGMQRLIPIPPAVFGFSAGVPGHPPKSHSPGLILEQPRHSTRPD